MNSDAGIIKILFMNAQSVVNKMDLLQTHVSELKPEIVAVTESWTHDDITRSMLKLLGYDLIGRRDRTDTLKGRGGGILLYSSLSHVYEQTVCKSEQIIHATIHTKEEIPDIHLHVFYRSPNATDEMNEEVLAYVKGIPQNSILIGDFNYPEIDWPTLSCTKMPGKSFLDTVNDKFLNQLVDFPTNLTPQPNGSITATSIDLVLTDNDNLIASVKPIGQLGASHHTMIMVEMIAPAHSNDTSELVPDYKKADFSTMREKMSAIDWKKELDSLNASDGWEYFKQTVSSTVASCIPMKKRRNSSKPLWMQRNTMRIIRKKRRLWKHYCTTMDYQSYLAYKRVQSETKSVIRKAKKDFEKKLAADAKKNPKSFYRYMNSTCKVQSKVGPLKDSAGNVMTDDTAQATVLNEQFVSCFTREDMSTTPVSTQKFDPAESGPPLTSITVDSETVSKKIAALNPDKSCGPDKIHARTLKEISTELSEPIAIIFNKCLSEHVVPDDWKMSNVTAIFKKGDKTDPGNYRPISLTSIICRILESILRDAILLHLRQHKLINNSQHGFWPHRSCATNLLEFLEIITKLIDEGHNIDVVYLDFSKAFDKVPHVRLMSKVRAHGICGDIADWIEEWLSGRKQRVVLNGKESNWADVLSGVPQGSVLGPILFLIYINDIDDAIDIVTTFMKKFADDTKVGAVTDSLLQCRNLQEQINSLKRWADIWQMSFNADKCVVMHLGSKNLQHYYTIDGKPMKSTDCEKDIGVYIQPSLKPSVMIAESVKKANRVLGMLLRNLSFRDRYHFIRLYKTYVRCHLEYAVQTWNPWLVQDIENIEAVQRRAVNSCRGLYGSYEQKLQAVGLTTLCERRMRGDMLQTFKIIHQIDDVDPGTWFTKVSECHQMTRTAVSVSEEGEVVQNLNLVKPKCRLDVRRNFFSCRVVEPWNGLPSSVQEAGDVGDFKVKYDAFVRGTHQRDVDGIFPHV